MSNKGILMEQTLNPKSFTSNGRTYSLNMSGPTMTVKINGKDISQYLAPNSSVGWYDVSIDSGRSTNANGKMILNVVSTKYRLDLATNYLTSSEFIDFFSEIIKQPTMTIEFYNPFTGGTNTISAYRGDRTANPYMPNIVVGTTIALIEL